MKIVNTNWIWDMDGVKHIVRATIIDDDEITWLYDSQEERHRQLRVPEADGEHTRHEENGFVAYSFSEAILILKEEEFI